MRLVSKLLVWHQYLNDLKQTKAGAVLVGEAHAADVPSGTVPLVVRNPYLAFARISQLFGAGIARPHQSGRRHPSADISSSAVVDPSADIGPFVTIEAGTAIGAGATIGAGCTIGRGVTIGAGCWLAPRVSIYYDCCLGQDCIVHSGVVIGADGFGFASSNGAWEKIEQLGAVVIGNAVEIGANTTIDRGAMGNTLIGDGCKLDNQIQIAHNVQIGDHTAIAACVGIAGSAIIGKNCMLGGSAGVLGHLHICDGVTISAMSLVMSSIDKPGFYSGIFPLMENAQWERSAVVVRQLPQLRQRIRHLESPKPENSE
jgi:UDP-3-O-[3-hydroxymyristoyl] glucosamine N-acyltransferase